MMVEGGALYKGANVSKVHAYEIIRDECETRWCKKNLKKENCFSFFLFLNARISERENNCACFHFHYSQATSALVVLADVIKIVLYVENERSIVKGQNPEKEMAMYR